MNKKILYFFITSTAPAALLAGPYAGVHGGIGLYIFNSNVDADEGDATVVAVKQNRRRTFAEFGLHLGYSFDLNQNFDLGLELGINPLKIKDSSMSVDSGENATLESKFERGMALQPTISIGYKLNSKNRLYLRLGAEIARYKHQYIYISTGAPANNRSTTASKTKVAPLIGVGHTWSISDKFTLDLEGMHVFCNFKNTETAEIDPSGSSIDTITQQKNKSKTTLLFRLNYKI